MIARLYDYIFSTRVEMRSVSHVASRSAQGFSCGFDGGHNPILDKTCYVDMDECSEDVAAGALEPWRVEQRRGEAVYVPAGCAHQVTNVRPNIKVAQDFVPPEAVEECLRLETEHADALRVRVESQRSAIVDDDVSALASYSCVLLRPPWDHHTAEPLNR